jgi:hypothetical protein
MDPRVVGHSFLLAERARGGPFVSPFSVILNLLGCSGNDESQHGRAVFDDGAARYSDAPIQHVGPAAACVQVKTVTVTLGDCHPFSGVVVGDGLRRLSRTRLRVHRPPSRGNELELLTDRAMILPERRSWQESARAWLD